MSAKNHITSEEIKSKDNYLPIYFSLLIGWTLIFGISLYYNLTESQSELMTLAKQEAVTAYEKDILYRRWNTLHGGVYVPVTETTQPNPYLITERRDIETISGKKFTLINPAYMTRQVYELAEEQVGIIGHMTSLDPIRPENAPDDWEKQGLMLFEEGGKEYSEVVEYKGGTYLRLIKPFVTEPGCLACHADQGYKVGDIRGGISVAVPMEDYLKAADSRSAALWIGHILLYLAGVLFLTSGFVKIRNNTKKLYESEESLKEINAAKDTFFSIIGHDLRNPFTTIIGIADLMELKYDNLGKDSMMSYIKDLKSTAQQTYSFLDNLLNWARLQTGKIQVVKSRFNLAGEADLAINLIQAAARKKNITVTNTIDREFFAFADRFMISTVLRNLLSNAVKFTPPGGNIDVTAVQKGSTYSVSVKDNGVGMTEETRTRLFRIDSIQTKKGTNDEKGTGLGLILCKEFVTKNNGTITVESTLGEGTVFTFTVAAENDNSETGNYIT